MSQFFDICFGNKYKINVTILFVSLIFFQSSLQANNSCLRLYTNEKQPEANLDPVSEFKLRLSRGDFQSRWGSSLDPSIIVVRYAIGSHISHYAARVVRVTHGGDLEVIGISGENIIISRADLASARMGGYGTVKTFEDHEKEFDPPYKRIQRSPVTIPTVKESPRTNVFLFDEYKIVLDAVAPPLNFSKNFKNNPAYINQGYWREWINDGEIPDQGWKLHVSAPVEMAGKIAAAILPKLRDYGIMHKVVSDLPRYAAKDSTDTQYGKFITLYPKNNRDAVLIKNFLVTIFRENNLTGVNFPQPPGELQIATGVFARFGRFTTNLLTVNGRQIPGSKNMILLPNGKIVKDERGGPIPEGISNPF